MNVTLAEAEEVHVRKDKAGQRAELGEQEREATAQGGVLRKIPVVDWQQ